MGCCFSKNKIHDIQDKRITQEDITINNYKLNKLEKDAQINLIEIDENKIKDQLKHKNQETENENEIKKDKIDDSNEKEKEESNDLIVEEVIDENIDEKIGDNRDEIKDENKDGLTNEFSLEEWHKMLNPLLNNLKLIQFVLNLKRTNFETLNELVKEFVKFTFNNDLEKAWMIYVWITHNIEYDKKLSGISEANEASTAFKTGKCVCEGYSNLYNDLCQRLRVESRKVSGYVKGDGYKLGREIDKKEQAHAWTAIRIDSKWYNVDSTWGAGGVKTNELNETVKKDYNPRYFLTPPQFLMFSHWSEDFQLQRQKIQFNSFEEMLNLDLNYHFYELDCLTHKSSVIKAAHNPIFIEFRALKNIHLSASLEDESKQQIENLVFIQKDSNSFKIGVIVYLPEMHKNYILKIFAGKQSELIQLKKEFVVKFLIRRDEANVLDHSIPEYNLSYLFNITCLSHKSSIIKSVQSPEFIELSVPKNVEMIFNIAQHTGNELSSISEDKLLIQRDSNTYNYGIFLVNLKLHSKYVLKLYAKLKNDSKKEYNFIGEMMIHKQANNLNQNTPSYSLEFNYGIKCVSHKSCLIESNKNPIFLELSSPKQTLIIANLFSQNSTGLFENKINEAVMIQRDSVTFNYGLFVFIPEKNKKYKLQIYAKQDDESFDSFYVSLNHFFLVSSTREKEFIFDFPKYSLEFKYGLKLESHSSMLISTLNKILFVEFSAPSDIKIICDLEKKNSSGGFEKIERNHILIQRDKRTLKYGIFIILPTKFEFYKFCVFANYVTNLSNNYDFAGYLLVLRNGDELRPSIKMPNYTLEFKNGLKCLSHFSQVIESKSNIEKLIFSASQNTQLLVNLYDLNDNKLENRVLAQRDYANLNNFEIRVVIPQKENFYLLKIFCSDEEYYSNSYNFLTSFILYTYRNNIDEKDLFYITTYSSEITSYLINPVFKYLKLNKTYEFKLYVKDGVKVCLNFQNEWFNLIEEDGSIWFLIKTFEAPGEVGIFASVDRSSNLVHKICSYEVIN